MISIDGSIRKEQSTIFSATKSLELIFSELTPSIFDSSRTFIRTQLPTFFCL